MGVGRPEQKKQTSRKGKRAWRKNIDIEDVEEGVEKQREDLRLLGTDDVDSLFTVDTIGDERVKSKYARDAKILRSSEILQQRSKAPALDIERNKSKTIQGVSKKEVHRLMKLAGKVQGETQTKTIYEKEGLIKDDARDLWGEPESKKNAVPKIYEEKSAVSITRPKSLPRTMQEEPIKLKDTVKIAHSGKSYNPSLDSWGALIQKEFKNEQEKEDHRLALESEKTRIQYLIENFDDKGELSSDEDSDEEDEEGEDDEAADIDQSKSLSINAPTQRKIKTQTQRNKEKRHAERVKLEQELKQLKAQIKELEKLPEIVSSLADSEESKVTKNKKRKARLFKYENIEQQLEVKLSDELTDSLRALKPEGNLFYDQMMKIQNSGKIEARKTVYKKRKYAPKITEKWTYKDFK